MIVRYPIIPNPQILEERSGYFKTQQLLIVTPKDISTDMQSIEESLRNLLLLDQEKSIHFQIVSSAEVDQDSEHYITIYFDSVVDHEDNESYELNIAENQIEITTSSETGIFYAIQTLLQLISIKEDTNEICIPCCRIVDWPAFPIRGFMHDVGRNFISVTRLKQQMRVFARYKINVFHWHMTDNPAFRIESRAYSELNDPKNHRKTRNPGKFYTYDEIHEFVAFCKSLHITVIPEIDVPGHSKYFFRTFKTRMNSRKGMSILHRIFNEFLSEFSKEEFPYIHIGGDEIHIRNPRRFTQFITQIVHNSEREIFMWNPGLTPPFNAILHNWGDYSTKQQRYIDSKQYYLNNMELFSGLLQIYYSQPCGVASFKQSNGLALGSILCLWPDVNVIDESTTERFNFLYPAIITFSERSWRGNERPTPEYEGTLPTNDFENFHKFEEFEERLLFHRDKMSTTVFFPYVKQSHLKWNIIGPFRKDPPTITQKSPEQGIFNKSVQNGRNFHWIERSGATLTLSTENRESSLYPGVQKGIAFALTFIYSQKEQEITVWIGFETPIRSNRQYRGIPKKDQWDSNGGAIWLNNIVLTPPNWANAGKFHYPHTASWNLPHHEIPYCDEEFYWTRKPYKLSLARGWNKLLVKTVKSYRKQNWIFTFVPLSIVDGKFKELLDLEYMNNLKK